MGIFKKILKLIGSVNVKIFSICLGISAFIWLMMTLGEEFSQEIEVEVVYTEAPEGLILVNKPVHVLKMDVQAQGYKLASNDLGSTDPVRIDLSKLELRKTPYNRYVAAVSTKMFKAAIQSQMSINITSNEFTPDSLYFVFDSLKTMEIPIKVNHNLSFESGFTIVGRPKVKPEVVKVTGPLLQLRKLKYIGTDTLKLFGLSKDRLTNLRLINPDSLFDLETNEVEVSVDVEHFSEFTNTVNVTAQSTIPGLKIKTFPARVKINYQMTLPDYKLLSDTSFMTVVTVDSMNILHQKRLLVKLSKVPENAKNISIEPQTVEFVIIKGK
jgi:hypothetical protein